MNFNDLTRKFLIGEWKQNVSIMSRARAIKEAKEGKNQKTLIDSDGKISAPDFKKRTSYK